MGLHGVSCIAPAKAIQRLQDGSAEALGTRWKLDKEVAKVCDLVAFPAKADREGQSCLKNRCLGFNRCSKGQAHLEREYEREHEALPSYELL